MALRMAVRERPSSSGPSPILKRTLLALALLIGIPVIGAFGWLPSALPSGYTQIALGTAWTLFHILIISLQAYIFMVLTVVYMAMAADHH